MIMLPQEDRGLRADLFLAALRILMRPASLKIAQRVLGALCASSIGGHLQPAVERYCSGPVPAPFRSRPYGSAPPASLRSCPDGRRRCERFERPRPISSRRLGPARCSLALVSVHPPALVARQATDQARTSGRFLLTWCRGGDAVRQRRFGRRCTYQFRPRAPPPIRHANVRVSASWTA